LRYGKVRRPRAAAGRPRAGERGKMPRRPSVEYVYGLIAVNAG
jgi:hypothetical protein